MDVDAESYEQLKNLISSSGDPSKMPSRKELLDLLEASELADDVKENLRTMLMADVPQVLGGLGGGFLAVLFVLALFSIILFFGYKLFKSIKEKERKKEEKKKAKQMKKKK